MALCVGLLACGGSSKSTTSTGKSRSPSGSSSVTAYFPGHHNDRDNDGDSNDDDGHDLNFGHAANAADLRESTRLVRRYYAAAATEDGATACALLAPFIAESVVETDGEALHSKTCSGTMSALFKDHHSLLVVKQRTLRIPEVRVEGDTALAILEFPTIPEVRQLHLRRIGGTWYVLELLDDILE